MNKSELVDAIANDTGLSKKDSEAALKSFIENVSDALVKGDSVQLIGFGTFSISERKARSGRNPKTKEKITIAASKNAKFKVGKALKDRINKK